VSQGQPIDAELIGSNECRAAGIVTRGHTPILSMCRALVGAYDTGRVLHVYRGKVLALTVRSIGEGARLTVKDSSSGRPGFRRLTVPQPRTLPLAASPGLAPPDVNEAVGEAAVHQGDDD
jgi:hypothetical protein